MEVNPHVNNHMLWMGMHTCVNEYMLSIEVSPHVNEHMLCKGMHPYFAWACMQMSPMAAHELVVRSFLTPNFVKVNRVQPMIVFNHSLKKIYIYIFIIIISCPLIYQEYK